MVGQKGCLQGCVPLLALPLLLRCARLGVLHALLRHAGALLIRQPASPQLHRPARPGLLHLSLNQYAGTFRMHSRPLPGITEMLCAMLWHAGAPLIHQEAVPQMHRSWRPGSFTSSLQQCSAVDTVHDLSSTTTTLNSSEPINRIRWKHSHGRGLINCGACRTNVG